MHCDNALVASHGLVAYTHASNDKGFIQAASPEKRQLSVQRKIGVFLKGLTDAKRLWKKLNLKVQAGNFRDAFSAEVSWEIARLFCHFAPDFQSALTPKQWAEVLERLF